MGKLTFYRADVTSVTLHWPYQLVLGFVIVSSAFAQSSANFETETIAPAINTPAEEQVTPPTSSAVVAPVSTTPSRNISATELKSYIDSIATVFLIRGRARDSFGQNQDPDAKPVIKASTPLAVRRSAPAQTTPFADIVRLLDVTTIMPREQRFLIGSRSFKLGDIMPLNFRNKPIHVVITEVTSRQISFRNRDSGEIAVRKLDMLPTGMTAGSRGISAPGMMPELLNAPIDLEAADPVSSNSKN